MKRFHLFTRQLPRILVLLLAFCLVAAPASDAAPLPEQRKWPAYLVLDEQMDDNLFAVFARYTEAFGDSDAFAGPPTERQRVKFINAVSRITDLLPAVDSAAALAARSPQSPLDVHVLDLAAVLRPLIQDIQALTRSLRDKKRARSGYGEAEHSHARIVAALAAFRALLPEYDALMATEKARQRGEALKRMRADGKRILPASLTVLLDAEAIHAFLRHRHPYQGNPPLSLDELLPLHERFSADLALLDPFQNEHSAEGEGLRLSRITFFRDRAAAFKREAEALITLLRQNKIPRSPLDDGAPKSIAREYSRMENAYNLLVKDTQ